MAQAKEDDSRSVHEVYVTTFMQTLAGEGVGLNENLRSIFARILARQLDEEEGQINEGNAFEQLAKVFTFVASPSGNRPDGPVYDSTTVEAARNAANAAIGPEDEAIFTGGEAFAPDDNLVIAMFSSADDSESTDLLAQTSLTGAMAQTLALGQTQRRNDFRWISQFTPDCNSSSENGYCGFAAVLMGADYLLNGQTDPPAPAKIGYNGETPGWLYDSVENAFGADSFYLNCGGPDGIHYNDIPKYAEALGLYGAYQYQGLGHQAEQWITEALASNTPVLALVPYQGSICSGHSGVSRADFYAGGSITREMMPCESNRYRHWVLVADIDQDSVLVYDSDPFATSREAGIRRYSKSSFFKLLPDTRPKRSGQPVMFKLCSSAEVCDYAPEAFSTVTSIELSVEHTYTADEVAPVVNPLVSQYTFSATGLPMGLTMDTEGRIVGITSMTGVFYPTITMRSMVNGAERIATWVIELIVNPDAQQELQFITKSQLPNTQAGHFYLQFLSTTPTLESVGFSHTGNLPPGLFLLDRMITGIPLFSGEWSFQIEAFTDLLTTTKEFLIRVDPRSASVPPPPILDHVEPEALFSKDGEQHLRLIGSQFSENARVRLRNVTDDVEPFIKVPEIITSTEINLRANFSSSPADWQVVVINHDGVESQPVEFSVVPISDKVRPAVWPSAWTPIMNHLLEVTVNYGAVSEDCLNVDKTAIWRAYVSTNFIKEYPNFSRSEHLGLDLRGTAESPVLTIAPGKVLAVVSWGEMGDAVLIEHWTTLGEVFTAVYGHVDSSVSAGAEVKGGVEIGTIYDLEENSHLHFGVARGRQTSVPGFANSSGGTGDACLPSPGVTVDPEGFLNTRLPADSPPDTVLPLSPANTQPGTEKDPGPILSSTTVTLNWSGSSGANYYEVGVRDMTSNLLVVNITTTTTSLPVNLSPDRNYRWNVAACNSVGCSSYTPRLYFQTPNAIAGDIGHLQVTLQPSEAVDAGAQWRRVNTDSWFDSEDTETNIPIGGQTVQFKYLGKDWVAPNNAGVAIKAGETTTLTRTYMLADDDPTPPVAAYPLNDTGIDWCADGNSNFLDCPVAGYPGQDAEYGRDVTHNNPSDGHAGFSFTKLDADGRDLPADASDWSCVRDNVTGLIWEVKTDDGGLHDKDDRYNWYNTDPSTNGGFEGYADYHGIICDGYDSNDPASYYNTQAFVERVNQRSLCGARDWRLPSRHELLSIVSNDRTGPAIDTDYFPNTVSSRFWSSSPYAYGSHSAWYVNFNHGYVLNSPKAISAFRYTDL
ncbi:DUF1566 domain-containing protein [Halochromatium salexigens]|uniref:Lcl domain-containing protein n=1 Tax=Halochromatium salexigens TaxID=49447 RepID=UPI0019148D91